MGSAYLPWTPEVTRRFGDISRAADRRLKPALGGELTLDPGDPAPAKAGGRGDRGQGVRTFSPSSPDLSPTFPAFHNPQVTGFRTLPTWQFDPAAPWHTQEGALRPPPGSRYAESRYKPCEQLLAIASE